MAVAGLHNVSEFGPSLFAEHGNNARASSLLQMWRELEGVTHPRRSKQQRNDSASECLSTSTSLGQGSDNGDDNGNDSEDNNSVISELSSDLGEIERVRLRQNSHECERVRISHHPEIGMRRPIRRLCGRQTLLDLILKAQNERNRDLQVLSERRPVSDFAHRNRIHALLRGRFLRNVRLIPDEKPSCRAATELGLLRERHTVSGLREGFLSKLDNSASTSTDNTAEPDSSNEPSGNTENLTALNLENAADENTSQQEFAVEISEVQEDPVLLSEGSEQEISPSPDFENVDNREEPVLDTEASEEINPTITNYSLLETEDIIYEAADHITEFEVNTNDENNRLNDSPESIIEIEDSGAWQQLNSVAFTEWVDDVEQDQIQESHEEYWPTHDLQEAIDSWLDMPSAAEVGSSLGRADSFYFPDDDDDNVQTMELRELFSRRRVSSLLRSGFRESLDQVLQSHMERLGHHASGDWEMDNISSSPAIVEQDQERLNGERALGLSDGADRNPFAPTSALVTAPEPLWEEDLPGANWPRNLNQQFGMEWEVINELRIDIAMLQQRMDNMQNLLEACMDMQIELQRTVRQEVSAALNRSILSRDADASQVSTTHDEFQWDQVRKGICCLCSDGNIDSLLYRCGHMCTCSKCAEKLVQLTGKCPMCRAPVVEAVRAYFTQ
ncbi:hypothetical protein ACJIZ3_011459 [Penstemon smallii]|uniref:RING-type domain-containing protein n=1 Tax=Penstemon smallii TaxID=265156 RepID=A0ABD3UMQ4_9LAMI